MNTRGYAGRRGGSAALGMVVVASLGVSGARGGDFAPPSYRGDAGSIRAGWDFASPLGMPTMVPADSFVAVPTLFNDPLSGVTTRLEVEATGAGVMWVAGDGDGGLTPNDEFGAFLNFYTENFFPTSLTETLLRVQLTYSGEAPTVLRVLSGSSFPNANFVGGGQVGVGQAYSDWAMGSTPFTLVVVFLPGGSVLDQVVVDTVVPGPGAAGVMVLGLAMSSRRRRVCPIQS